MRNKALSPFISTALIMLIGIVTISLVLGVVNPSLDKARDSAVINEAFRNLNLIDNTIKEVVSEGENSRRTIQLRVTEGLYEIDSNSDSLNFTYSMKTNLSIGGYKDGVNITLIGNVLSLFIIYNQIEIQGYEHFTKGDNSVVISHIGVDSVTNYPIIQIEK